MSQGLIIVLGLSFLSIIIISGIAHTSLSIMFNGQPCVDLSRITYGNSVYYLIALFIIFIGGSIVTLINELNKSIHENNSKTRFGFLYDIFKIIVRH